MKKIIILVILSILVTICLAEDLINTTFYNTFLTEALNEIALQTGKTILTDEYVQGVVSADFFDVPLEEALKILLIPGGYSYRKLDENTYFVGLADPRSRTFHLLTEFEIIELKYITTNQFLALVPDSYRTFIKTVPEYNNLYIHAPRSTILELKKYVERIDVYTPDLEYTVYIVEVEERYSNLIEGNYIELYNADSHQIRYANNMFSFSWEGLVDTQFRMFEQNNLAQIVSKKNFIGKNKEIINLTVLNKNNIYVSQRDANDRLVTVEDGVSINLRPSVLGEIIELEMTFDISKAFPTKENSYNTTQSNIRTKVNLRPSQLLMIANLDVVQKSELSSGPPNLKNLALVRLFFSKQVVEESNKRLMIFLQITPVEKRVGLR